MVNFNTFFLVSFKAVLFLGTQWGKLFLLDALGNDLSQNQPQFGREGRHTHSVAVSQISIG